MNQLIPKNPRRKKQPTVAWYRQQVADLTAEVIQLRLAQEQKPVPFWRRWRKE